MRRTRRDTTRNTFTSKRKPPNKHKKQPRALQRQWYRQRASPAEPSRTTAGPRAAAPAGDGGSQGTPGRLLRSPAGALSTQVASAAQCAAAPAREGPTSTQVASAAQCAAALARARGANGPREPGPTQRGTRLRAPTGGGGGGGAAGGGAAGGGGGGRGTRLAHGRCAASEPPSRRRRRTRGEHLLAGGTPSTPAGTEGKLRASRAARLARCSTAPLRPASSGARAESPSGRQRRGPRWCRGSL
ncbi:unnamed protein product [Prorocentrum cordatum]|uniref:Uncharacterized protein n=1 Tax=Prorocentrum cordatum TaxID=2364126 RepID=A0ABN9S9V9_9DINO|nr:unnamed protein product [Polarella glacialis]